MARFVNTLRKIRRVLKPGGYIILLSEGYRDKKFEKRNEKWEKFLDLPFYLPEEFREFLREAGYSSIQIDTLESKNWIRSLQWGQKNELSLFIDISFNMELEELKN